MMNVECGGEALAELESAFRFNDAVLRNLTIRRKAAITETSHLARKRKKTRHLHLYRSCQGTRRRFGACRSASPDA